MKIPPCFCECRGELLTSEAFACSAETEMADLAWPNEGGMFWDEIDWLWDCVPEWEGDTALPSGMGESVLH